MFVGFNILAAKEKIKWGSCGWVIRHSFWGRLKTPPKYTQPHRNPRRGHFETRQTAEDRPGFIRELRVIRVKLAAYFSDGCFLPCRMVQSRSKRNCSGE
jgi:hypothetical protein